MIFRIAEGYDKIATRIEKRHTARDNTAGDVSVGHIPGFIGNVRDSLDALVAAGVERSALEQRLQKLDLDENLLRRAAGPYIRSFALICFPIASSRTFRTAAQRSQASSSARFRMNSYCASRGAPSECASAMFSGRTQRPSASSSSTGCRARMSAVPPALKLRCPGKPTLDCTCRLAEPPKVHAVLLVNTGRDGSPVKAICIACGGAVAKNLSLAKPRNLFRSLLSPT